MAEDYKTQVFRNRCAQQIGELLRLTPNNMNKSAGELEMQIFNKSKKKEDYLVLLNRVLNHLKDQAANSNQNNPHLAAMLAGQSTPTMQGQMNQGQMGQAGQQMHMGTQMGHQQQQQQLGQGQIGQNTQMGNQQIGQVSQMGGAMGQTNPQLGQGQMVGHNNQGMGGMGSIGQPMGMSGVPVSHGQPMGMASQVNQMGPNGVQGGQIGINRMSSGNQMMGQMTIVGQTASSMGMGGGQVITSNNAGMMGPNQGMVGARMTSGMTDMSWQGGNAHMSMGALKPGMNTISGNMTAKIGQMQLPLSGPGSQQMTLPGRGVPVTGGTGNMQPRIPSPNFSGGSVGNVARQNVSNPGSSIPSSICNMTGQQNTQPQLMPQHSPAFIAPSPTSTIVPSPVSSGGGGRGGVMGAPSPNTVMVNTPGQTNIVPSPVSNNSNQQVDEKAYFEKLKQLQKYVDPLKAFVAKYSNVEGKTTENAKSKKLLDLLQGSMETLLPLESLEQCEKVLMKMDFLRDMKGDSESQSVHKESAVDVLMEGIRAALSAPNSANIFHRTISPALEKLTGCSIPMPPPPSKKRKLEEPQKDCTAPKISYVIQGEVARLSPRFKVNHDSNQPSGSDDLTLICHLDDCNLPCVPPLTLTIPQQYPDKSPVAILSHLEYDATEFLQSVESLFSRRQQHMPLSASITLILDTWEMSIRKACSPTSVRNPDAVSPITAIMELMNEAA